MAELRDKAASPEVVYELDSLAGERRWDGSREPLTSPVEVTDGAIELTLNWIQNESAVRPLLSFGQNKKIAHLHMSG
jgi:hypothetical protein